ncbi:MAG: SDR family oxidoreductase [Alphaproteobacteria bacterium]|nr:SDR family oxidoreductase [Alphaproteobacteria bacterium]
MSDAFAIYPSLKDRPVVVSGGASGIGEALVRAFAGQGARVGFVDIQAERGEALAAELGASVSFVACDITDIAAYRAAIAGFAERHGPALALVNNAAYDGRHDWRQVTPEDWDARMAVNLKQAFFAIQAVAPGMIETGTGSIVNLGSIAWMVNTPQIPAYATAKAAALGLSRSMANELGPHGIRVNTLAPGAIMTERQRTEVITPEMDAHMQSLQVIKGHIMPEDVARLVLFLCADDSRMITGQQFLVDGGWAFG